MSVPLFDFQERISETDPRRFYPALGKRLFDLAVILFMAPVVLPLMLCIFLSVALSGGRPLFSQMRIGRDGRVFRCWKFRTMIPDADAALVRILREDSDLAEEWRRKKKDSISLIKIQTIKLGLIFF